MFKEEKPNAELLKDAIKKLEEDKEHLEIMDRALVLMEAGLQVRPLDRDLFQLVKFRHAQNKRENESHHYIAKSMLAMVERESKEGRTDNEPH